MRKRVVDRLHRDGWAALKGLDHESTAWSKHPEKLSSALQRAIPVQLARFSSEPAFRWDATSFSYFRTLGSQGWTRANDLTAYSRDDAGEDKFLALLIGEPSDYVGFASDYYEVDLKEQVIAGVFALQPITDSIVAALNSSTTLHDISEELFQEIHYP
jgi:hypothetical protein